MYFKLVVYTKLFFLTLKQKGQITEYIENVNSPVISQCWREGRAQSFQTGAHNLNQNGKWALNPINSFPRKQVSKVQNYTLKGPLFTSASKQHSRTDPTKQKREDQKSHPLILHFQGLASNLDISEWAMLQKNIKLGHWIQAAHPLRQG